jgi:molybdopterin-containing oxidoreductase family iron-sulfur binding subunit
MTNDANEHVRLPLLGGDDPAGLTRREMLRVMAAAMALAGGTGCRQPRETIVPYVHPPEDADPSAPLQFATATTRSGLALGLLVTSRGGRPIKVEGNPDHPASLGATDAFAQALVLGLYDPDRSQAVLRRGTPATWDAARAALHAAARGQDGAGLCVLSESMSSPTLIAQRDALLQALPRARWYAYDPVGRGAAREGARLAFGRAYDVLYRVGEARVVLALEADLFCDGAAGVRYAREFAQRRTQDPGAAQPMNRLYAVESAPTLTGACADHRLALPPSKLSALVGALARELGASDGAQDADAADPRIARFVAPLARDLRAEPGTSIVALGPSAPAALHALVHRINHALGNVGRTTLYVDPIGGDEPAPEAALAELCAEMRAGAVRTLLVLSGNPVSTAPRDLGFAGALARVPFSMHLGLYADETAARCQWHVPEAHELERWSDALAHDGTASIVQPLIAPLYGGKSAHEVVAALLDEHDANGYDVVRATWQRWHAERNAQPAAAAAFEAFWSATLHAGVVTGSSSPTRTPQLQPPPARAAAEAPPSGDGGAIEVSFRPDPAVWDGRFANNAWLQECPRPLTKITWDNAVLLAPATAARLGVAQDQVVRLAYRGREVRGPVCLSPGHAEGCATLHLGYGRTRAGRVGDGVGFDAYALRTSDAPWGGPGLRLHPTGARHAFARTQGHHRIEGRDLVRTTTPEALARGPAARAPEPPQPSLFPPAPRAGHAWGMTIDLAACTGCNACVIACQAENNVPSVGKREVMRQREMHWLRVDSYQSGSDDDPSFAHQVVLCMHCETAPCELVCPVGATVHDHDGLNEMVYNRCVGTRYCSNNCPYKVRRFNFFHYAKPRAPVLEAVYNPDVSVRSRGVMEKCTYCVQRIQHARIAAGEAGRAIRDGEIETACQAACPSRAIVFGDVADRDSRVARQKRSPRNYELLRELDTRPRTTYLARVLNPNPDMPKGA